MSARQRRQLVTVLALVGIFVSGYLLLYELGFYGALVCGEGHSCEYVQSSSYAWFLGIPVAGWGLGWYLAVFATGMVAAGSDARAGEARLLLVLATAGLAFSAYLTSIEAFVLHAWCRWCLGSAFLTILIFLLALPWGEDRREIEGAPEGA